MHYLDKVMFVAGKRGKAVKKNKEYKILDIIIMLQRMVVYSGGANQMIKIQQKPQEVNGFSSFHLYNMTT